MWEAVSGIVIGAIGSILAVVVVHHFEIGRGFLRRVLGLPYQIASNLAAGGIRRLSLSRGDYHKHRIGGGSLRGYLATAKYSIDIVSISLNVTQAEEALIELLEQKINADATFRVRVTLLNPSSPVTRLLAKSLDLEPGDLEAEIRDTLDQLMECKQRLPSGARRRLGVYVHDTLPIGSAILLDATPERGTIQVETKLYRAPRTESFGFEVVGPSPFYLRNYAAWQKAFDDSYEWLEAGGRHPSLR